MGTTLICALGENLRNGCALMVGGLPNAFAENQHLLAPARPRVMGENLRSASDLLAVVATLD
jgi:hypothetical protein